MTRSPDRTHVWASLAAAGIVLGAASCKRDEHETSDGATAPARASVQARAGHPAASASGMQVQAPEADDDCCMGKNPCRGKGGCAVPESHACQGQNDCAGKGGCRAHCPR